MCIDQWRISHVSGDVTVPRTLCQALAFRNFEFSPLEIQLVAKSVLKDADCDLALDGKLYPTADQCCLGPKTTDPIPITYVIVPWRKLFPLPITKKTTHDHSAVSDNLRALIGNILFVSDWRDEDCNPAFSNPELIDCTELAASLGIPGTTPHWGIGANIAIIALQSKHLHKPTLLDAGFAYFWYAAPDQPQWGLTRSIRTGRPALREWVLSRSGDYTVVDYWRREFTRDCQPPNDEFWENCAREVRS